MGDYRHIDTGEVKTQGAWRAHYKGVSQPRSWTAATLDGLKLEPVFETPKPDAGQYQNAVRNGVEKDAKGNWVWAWAICDMFSDYTDEAGVLHTKAEQEAAYQAGLDKTAAKDARAERGRRLSATDWRFRSDLTPSQAWVDYCQALRDITAQETFPQSIVWPTEPE